MFSVLFLFRRSLLLRRLVESDGAAAAFLVLAGSVCFSTQSFLLLGCGLPECPVACVGVASAVLVVTVGGESDLVR
ncbi:hypothetical protein P8452_23031 [Trifolium repens]|nr:hypothetical protein P8452_23031 [Trifolium repens]